MRTDEQTFKLVLLGHYGRRDSVFNVLAFMNVQLKTFRTFDVGLMAFLQHVRIACNAERCSS